jgi:hypothetical protein
MIWIKLIFLSVIFALLVNTIKSSAFTKLFESDARIKNYIMDKDAGNF